MLKSDLHIHTREDPKDGNYISYSARQLIDRAAELNFDVLSITLHESLYYEPELVEYARAKGILLIPGVEALIEGKEVLIYNITPEEFAGIKKLSDLRNLGNHSLVVAPHPYFLKKKCLGSELELYKDCFDAIEFCHFYTNFINFNRKAELNALAWAKPLIATSDSHFMWQFGSNYTLIDSEKNINSVIDSIKQGKLKIHAPPLSLFKFSRILLNSLCSSLRRML